MVFRVTHICKYERNCLLIIILFLDVVRNSSAALENAITAGLNVKIYGRERDATPSIAARSTVQRNALIRAAACAEFERLTDPRDTHVSDEITRSSVRSRHVPGDMNKNGMALVSSMYRVELKTIIRFESYAKSEDVNEIRQSHLTLNVYKELLHRYCDFCTFC